MKNLFWGMALILGATFAGASAVAQTSAEEMTPLTGFQLLDGRMVLADAEGFTAYTFDPDSNGVSTCFDACEQAWPPILVEAGTALGAKLSVIVRPDGSHQLAFDGQPLYFFVSDKKPGDIKGDGVGGVWHIVVL